MPTNRPKEWPDIWLCPNHPQWTKESGKYRNKAYVYVCNTTPEGMEKALKLGASIKQPGLGDKGIADFGVCTFVIILSE